MDEERPHEVLAAMRADYEGQILKIDDICERYDNFYMTYKADAELDARLNEIAAELPDIDFTAPDGVRHTSWPVRDEAASNADRMRQFMQAWRR